MIFESFEGSTIIPVFDLVLILALLVLLLFDYVILNEKHCFKNTLNLAYICNNLFFRIAHFTVCLQVSAD